MAASAWTSEEAMNGRWQTYGLRALWLAAVMIMGYGVARAAGGENYVRTTVYGDASGSAGSARVSTTYFDGLGRERYVVLDGAGGDGSTVTQRTDYDRRGNVGKKWLPVPGSSGLTTPGAYKSAASRFYGADEIPYSQYTYEDNGLNRLTGDQGPGKLWNKHGKEYSWHKNQTSEKEKYDKKFICKKINLGTRGVFITVAGEYPTGSLRVSKVKDEDGMEHLTFRDRLDRVVLERAISNDTTFADTYYVYDNSGDLRFVVSPEGSALLPKKSTVKDVVLKKYAQAFTYDIHHRCISKCAPNCGETHYVYDKLGRVILESTAGQRAAGTWTMTKYDSNFRPAIRGLVQLSGKTREQLQSEYGDTLLIETPDYSFGTLESSLGYTSDAGPSTFQPYISWHYDNYDFITGPNAGRKAVFASQTEGYTQQGLCTGTIMKKESGGQTYVRAVKYDHRGAVVRSCFWDAYLNDFRLTDEYMYDFTGNEVSHTETYERIMEGSDIQERHQAVTTRTYDRSGRLLTATLAVDGRDPVVIQDLEYDGIGRLSADRAAAGTAYSYDIRSNLTGITTPVFSQQTWYGSTPAEGATPSYKYANASRLSWGRTSPYTHTEHYSYDGLGRYTAFRTDNNRLSEDISVNLNADVTDIVRRYRGDVVQDAVLEMDGCLPTAVHDASGPYWEEEVPGFPAGDYALEYDTDGRLTRDETRQVTSVTYHPYTNLPNTLQTSDGSNVISTYFADGTLNTRRFMTRRINIVVKVDANGDTIRTEKATSVIAMHTYMGNYEWTADNRCLYHTPAGHYDTRDRQHYWYVRNRLGSTVAVTDASGTLLQATGYYPSGTPYRLPEAGVATDITARTDQLHIGNRWIGHKGLNIYDNTARPHDPVLMRFHNPDPLYTSYPSHSPWAHCAANPLAFIDKTGMDYFQMDDRGYISLIYETDDDFDIIGANGNHLIAEKDFLQPIVETNIIAEGDIADLSIYRTNSGNAKKYFEFLANNSNVEWSIIYARDGNTYIGSAHLENKEGTPGYLLEYKKEWMGSISRFDHSHTKESHASEPDRDMISDFPYEGIWTEFNIYFVPEKAYNKYREDYVEMRSLVVYPQKR